MHGGAARNEEAFKLKEEYHHFRAMTARMLIGISGTLLYLIGRSLKISADPLRFEPQAHSYTPMVMVGVQVHSSPILRASANTLVAASCDQLQLHDAASPRSVHRSVVPH